MQAKQRLIKVGTSEKTVLDVNQSLKTVSLMDSIKRLQFLCNVWISEDFITMIQDINKVRNSLMHFEISLNMDQVENLIEKNKSLSFFID